MSWLAAIVGPTATGKTELAASVAEELGAEIISADSMVVYRGLDVGTAKPTDDQRARVRHHMIDLVDIGEGFSVQQFQAAARDVIERARAAGTPILVVGGTGLYVRAVLDDLVFPPTDASVRDLVKQLDAGELRAELEAADPVAAATIEPNNTRRIARAVEVIRLTGRPFSSFACGWRSYHPAPVAGLCATPGVLAARIRARAIEMFDSGIEDEAVRLDAAGSRTARAAIGYAEALAVVGGELDRPGAVERIVERTLQLARRQRAWFRSDPRVAFFTHATVAAVVAYFERRRAAL